MIACVTGASRGIGAAIAEGLASEGYDLYLTCDRTYDELCAVAERISSIYNVRTVPVRADMSDEGDVCSLFSDMKSLDVLVNNAGIACFGLLQDTEYSEWRRVMGVNLDSVFLTSREAARIMVRQHSGCIVNISSIWGVTGASMETAYSASKGGVNALTKALAKELAPCGIRVNALACGVIDTDMNKIFSREEIISIIEEIPADRMGKPSEIADIVVMLTKAPDYMTGQIITVDGGYI